MPILSQLLSQPVLDLIRHSYDSYITLQYHKLYCNNSTTLTIIIVAYMAFYLFLKINKNNQ